MTETLFRAVAAASRAIGVINEPVGISSLAATSPGPYSVEERLVNGDAIWIAIRARGAEWSWLTLREAAEIGRVWVEKYGCDESDPSLVTD